MPLGPEDITLTGKTLTGGTLSGVALGTPASGTLTNCSGLPASGVAGTAITNGGALGTPSSGTLTNCSGLPTSGINTGALTIGNNALTCGTVELGNGTDTTLAKNAAGQVSVEGDNLLRTTADIAAQADQETSTSTTKWVSPARQQFHPSAAKHWSVVTVSGGTHSLQTSYNMTSITDGATGIHTVTIATDYSSANWAACGSGEGSGTSVANGRAFTTSSKGAGSVVMSCYDFAATTALQDPTSASNIGFGDQ